MEMGQNYQALSKALLTKALLTEQYIARLERLSGNEPSLRLPQLLLKTVGQSV